MVPALHPLDPTRRPYVLPRRLLVLATRQVVLEQELRARQVRGGAEVVGHDRQGVGMQVGVLAQQGAHLGQPRVGVAEIARDKAYRKLADRMSWETSKTAYNDLKDEGARKEIDCEVARLHGGLAGGADIILIPEIPFDFEKISQEILRRDRVGAKCTMVVVAEGATPQSGRQSRLHTASGENRLGGIGEIVGREIGERTGKEVRTCVLGHLQRGGAPTMLDRILGTTFGVKAVQLIAEGKFGSMVSFNNYETHDVPIAQAVHKPRRVNPNSQIVKMARAVEIVFGD
jgi:hypothetical protein